jgi:hypothetical protein
VITRPFPGRPLLYRACPRCGAETHPRKVQGGVPGFTDYVYRCDNHRPPESWRWTPTADEQRAVNEEFELLRAELARRRRKRLA